MLSYFAKLALSSTSESDAPPPADESTLEHNPLTGMTARGVTGQQIIQAMHHPTNPFTNQPYSPTYKSLLHTRKSLPVYDRLESFVEMYQNHRVMLLTGETGSGKSTQIPQFVAYSDMPHKTGKMIAITQPRKIAATSIAERVAKEMDVTLGDEVGYAVRFEELFEEGKTILKYMTDGMLLRDAMFDRDLDKYSTIILDESQERSHSTDILMGLLKGILTRRNDLKVIIMSAVDNPRFFEYFGISTNYLSVPGRTYPVEEIFSSTDNQNFEAEAVAKVLDIHRTEAPGDVLVFLTGAREVNSACEKIQAEVDYLRRRHRAHFGPVSCLPLFAALPVEQQERAVMEPAPPPSTPGGPPGRKIIVATNVAETSLTIDGVAYVVDSGREKSEMFDPLTGIETLESRLISKASAQQRAGRAGRTRPGKCFRLYTQSRFQKFKDHTYPQILRCNLSTIVLMLIKLGIKDIMAFDFVSSPNPHSVAYALNLLQSLRAIDDFNEITQHGSIMVEFPMDPQLAKALVVSSGYGCSMDIVTIAAMLNAGNVWLRPAALAREADIEKAQFAKSNGDHMTLLNVYGRYIENKNTENGKWAWNHYLSPHVLAMAEDIRIQLKRLMTEHKLPLVSSGYGIDDPRRIQGVKKALLSGFFQQVAYGNPKRYRNIEDHDVFLSPSSVLMKTKFETEYVIYDKLLNTTRVFMHNVSSIDRRWLQEVAPHAIAAWRLGSIEPIERHGPASNHHEFKDTAQVRSHRSRRRA